MTPQHTADVRALMRRVRDGEYQTDRATLADAMLHRCIWIAAWDVVGGRPEARVRERREPAAGDDVVRLPDRVDPGPFAGRQAA